MTGYATIKKIRAFEERAAQLGFKILDTSNQDPTYSKYSTVSSSFKNVWYDEMSSETVSLAPVDDRYPCWRRGATVFNGTIEEANFFFQGIEFAHMSDAAIGLSNEGRRARAEAKYIERMKKLEAARIKKAEQKKVWDILKHGTVVDTEEVPF